MHDQHITEMFVRRNEQAKDALNDKYGAEAYALAYNILADEERSRKCVGESLQEVWDTVPPEDPHPIYTYFCRIVRKNALKMCENEPSVTIFDRMPKDLKIKSGVDSAELTRVMNDWFDRQDEKDIHLFLRRYWCFDTVEALAFDLRESKEEISAKLGLIEADFFAYLCERGVLV